MSPALTRVTLFVPGAPSAAAWRDAIDPTVDVEWIPNDGTFGQAFAFGTVAPDGIARIAAAPGALVLHWPIDLRAGRAAIVGAVARLRDAGALAVRLEQSKLGWEIEPWLQLFGSDDPGSWHRGAVAFLRGEGVLQSCGMHAFSLPDVRVVIDEGMAAADALALRFDLYQLAEDPVLRSGHTFAPDAETPRRLVERWPDIEYPAEHACHNPYGVWCLGPPGGTARAMGALAPTFIPPLRAILEAAAARQRTPLTRAQVETIRDESACIMMEPRDAQALERQRGYADLDPELAWDQWSLLQ